MKKKEVVTMRVRVGDRELEVTGHQDFVEKKIAEFVKAPIEPEEKGRLVSRKSDEAGTGKALSVAQFFKKCNLTTDNNRVLVAGYYLEKNKGRDNFTVSELKELFTEGRRKPPANTHDAVNQNIKKGMLMPAGDREKTKTFVVTSDGEEYVETLMTHLE
ncbi:MAG: hypothetical protein KKG09_07710 [Verrucomicrobia bacterium]|nr:hypothetical protein [Verrucomicrobiota bacterium]MCG2679406.1 hypothetical protein [Kiritimatiellia bacterium]MBU4247608.1 hypothetical protein [Verrucomicrobiota bacterium]MBU4289865.1 hypothetical protein [Verrucomicrobiota bacterium]MBU4428785.1 hypothetical protein [Verrucomicrobiota bacterium]